MKKLLLLLPMLFSVMATSQAISVSTTNHSIPQLVNNVLINSPCVSATNITYRTGTNFGSSNGIGFFQNTNPNFPLQSGVVLSTGDVANAVGPNDTFLNDGSSAWTGDSDLEATLAQAGIMMTSANATVLEFDFTPISSRFNFNFVFASEEYGNFQCQFSDAFAFLLTNQLTGETINLAVVPNTNAPISVVTIRDFLYNSGCPSANEQYFGSFNGGTAAPGSATNFNGETVILNASSVLTPNTPYHIKLVIADRSDYESDSAIFISSNSFNIGQDVLGLDLIGANNSDICFGQTEILDTGLDPAEYTFSWTRNGVTIPGASGPSINVTQPGTYGVTYTNFITSCVPVTDTIVIEYQPQFTTPAPKNLYRCDTGSVTHEFNLALNSPTVSAGITPAPTVTYYSSAENANAGSNPLPTTYVSAANETIFVRIQKADSPCFAVKSFTINVTPPALANQPPDLISCARNGTATTGNFNLNLQTPIVLNGLSAAINTVKYYTSAENAANGVSPIGNPANVALGTQTVYVRVQNITDPDCFSIASFNVAVYSLPPVDDLADVIICDVYILPTLLNGNYFTDVNGTGTALFAGDLIGETTVIHIFNQPNGPDGCSNSSSFKVTVLDPMTLSPASGSYCGSYALPTLTYGKYRTAPGGAGTVIAPGTVITTSQTLYVYYVTTTAPFCTIDTNFTVTILPAPVLPGVANVFDCVSYTLPPLSNGNYYTQDNGQGNIIPPGTVITASQRIYIYATGNTPEACPKSLTFRVDIGMPIPVDIEQCNPYTLPNITVGNYYTGPNGTGTLIPDLTVVDQSMTVHIYNPDNDCMGNLQFNISISQPPVDSIADVQSCFSYTLPTLTNGTYYTGPAGSGDVLQAGDLILSDLTVYIYAQLVAGCYNETSFDITINPLPIIDSRSSIDACNSYTLTTLAVGDYYTGPGGTGNLLPGGTAITTSQTIYIYGVNSAGCFSESSFDIFIFSLYADAPAAVTSCDSYTLPALTVGNYYTDVEGTGTMLQAGQVITQSTSLYVYIKAQERALTCSSENIFQITINQTPVIPPVNNVNVCNSYTLPALTVGNYYTGPNATGTLLLEGDVLTSTQTVHIFAHTATTPDCSTQTNFELTVFNVDEIADVVMCESYTLPALTIGKYYTASGGLGTQLAVGTTLSTSQTIYIYASAPFNPTCFDESSFDLRIINAPIANPVAISATTICDEDGTNDGITPFDLTTLNALVLGNQTGPEFSVTYFETMANAAANTDAVTTTEVQSVYARISNALAASCFDIVNILIKVNKLPEPKPVDGIICFNSTTQTLIRSYTIPSGLASASHTFEWRNETGDIVGNGSNYIAILPGTYTVTATSNATGCTSEAVAAVVRPSEPATISYTLSDDFGANQTINVIAVGVGGDYEYKLDFGPYQSSPLFANVASGWHTITVRDINGCGSASTEVLLVSYPRFFTPNGDGFNDTWNITDLKDLNTSMIDIYDRYGKLLKQITPNGAGWDGTYNGQSLPAADYWFLIHYEKDETSKEFRSHFSMKR